MDNDYYLIDSAEKTSRSASVQETRTLLYMMGQMANSKDIGTFVIDVANDVVSVNTDKTVFCNAQSKGEKLSSPKAIGTDLVTLYKDYLSILNFDCYILSLRNISNANLKKPITQPIKVLRYSDFSDEAQDEIRDSLKIECFNKEYIHERYSDFLSKIDDFLNEVILLVNDDTRDSYIKKIAFVNNGLVSSKELESIFEEIREKQLAIKTSCDVSGKRINSLDEQLEFGRNFKVETINGLVLERITGMSIINENKRGYYCPTTLIDYLASLKLTSEERDNYLEESVHELYKAFFNSNLNKEFWEFIFIVSELCKLNKTIPLTDIYNELLNKHKNLLYMKYLSKGAVIYLISNIVEGLKK